MKKNKQNASLYFFKPLLFALFAFVFALVHGNSAFAQQLDITKINEIPTYLGSLDEDSFVALTSLEEDVPLNDKSMSFQIRLPKAWRKSEEVSSGTMRGVSDRVLGEIVRYYSPSDFYTISRFSITALELPNAITARNWFLNYVMSNGYVLQGMKEISEREVEALYVLIDGDTSYSVRSKAVINGSRIFLISYFVPYQKWSETPQERGMQERVIQSFRFLHPEEGIIGQTEIYEFLDLVAFDYPSTWRLTAPNANSVEGMNATLVNTIDKSLLEGKIDIQIVSTESETTIAEEILALKREIKELGFKVEDVIEHDNEYSFHEDVYYNRVEVYRLEGIEGRIIAHEFWVAVLVEDRYFYIVTLMSPNRTDSFYTWAINMEAFATVIESIGPIVRSSENMEEEDAPDKSKRAVVPQAQMGNAGNQ